jgi:hypothetical protein
MNGSGGIIHNCILVILTKNIRHIIIQAEFPYIPERIQQTKWISLHPLRQVGLSATVPGINNKGIDDAGIGAEQAVFKTKIRVSSGITFKKIRRLADRRGWRTPTPPRWAVGRFCRFCGKAIRNIYRRHNGSW